MAEIQREFPQHLDLDLQQMADALTAAEHMANAILALKLERWDRKLLEEAMAARNLYLEAVRDA